MTASSLAGFPNASAPASFNASKTQLDIIHYISEIHVELDAEVVLYLSLICIQSFAVAADLTVKVPQPLRQAHGAMGAKTFDRILPQLLLQFATQIRYKIETNHSVSSPWGGKK